MHTLTVPFYFSLLDNPNPISSSYGWHFQYLTIIGLTLSTLTFLFGLTSDTLLSPTLFKVKNTLSLLSLPLSLLISLLYWSLRLIDPTLVVPPDFELPLSADVGFHATPTILLLVDLLFFSPPWTIAVLPALGLSSVIAVGYWIWVEHCYSVNGFYPYPLMELLGFKERVALFGGSAVLMAAVSGLIGWVYRVVNGVEMKRRV